MPENKTMTTAAGCPVADNQNSLTAGPRGPVLMQDMHLMEKLAHFNRERVLERVVQAVFPVDNFIAVFYFFLPIGTLLVGKVRNPHLCVRIQTPP